MSTVFRSVKLLFLQCIASRAGFFSAWLFMTEKKKIKINHKKTKNKNTLTLEK